MRSKDLIITVLALLAVAFALKTAAVPAREDAPSSGVAAAVTTATYTSSFAMQCTGGGDASGGPYRTKDRVALFMSASARQQSPIYQVIDLFTATRLGANNGLASGQGTIMKVSWSDHNRPANAKGFNVSRSRTNGPGSYVKVNPTPVTTTTYDDGNLANGVYFYMIYLVDSQDDEIRWTQPFTGVISMPADASNWMLYR